MTENIKDKVVVITGASSGLGAETARHLVREGAKVVLGARRLDRLEALAKELSLGEEAIFKVDVTDREQVKAFVDHAVKTQGKIDVMINNAGIMPLAPLEMMRFDEWDQCIDVNIKGVLWGIAAALPFFKEQKSGQFINVSSVAGHTIGAGGDLFGDEVFGARDLGSTAQGGQALQHPHHHSVARCRRHGASRFGWRPWGLGGRRRLLSSNRHSRRQLRPLRPLRHEPARERRHQRNPVSADSAGTLRTASGRRRM